MDKGSVAALPALSEQAPRILKKEGKNQIKERKMGEIGKNLPNIIEKKQIYLGGGQNVPPPSKKDF